MCEFYFRNMYIFLKRGSHTSRTWESRRANNGKKEPLFLFGFLSVLRHDLPGHPDVLEMVSS